MPILTSNPNSFLTQIKITTPQFNPSPSINLTIILILALTLTLTLVLILTLALSISLALTITITLTIAITPTLALAYLTLTLALTFFPPLNYDTKQALKKARWTDESAWSCHCIFKQLHSSLKLHWELWVRYRHSLCLIMAAMMISTNSFF